MWKCKGGVGEQKSLLTPFIGCIRTSPNIPDASLLRDGHNEPTACRTTAVVGKSTINNKLSIPLYYVSWRGKGQQTFHPKHSSRVSCSVFYEESRHGQYPKKNCLAFGLWWVLKFLTKTWEWGSADTGSRFCFKATYSSLSDLQHTCSESNYNHRRLWGLSGFIEKCSVRLFFFPQDENIKQNKNILKCCNGHQQSYKMFL